MTATLIAQKVSFKGHEEGMAILVYLDSIDTSSHPLNGWAVAKKLNGLEIQFCMPSVERIEEIQLQWKEHNGHWTIDNEIPPPERIAEIQDALEDKSTKS